MEKLIEISYIYFFVIIKDWRQFYHYTIITYINKGKWTRINKSLIFLDWSVLYIEFRMVPSFWAPFLLSERFWNVRARLKWRRKLFDLFLGKFQIFLRLCSVFLKLSASLFHLKWRELSFEATTVCKLAYFPLNVLFE